MQSSASDRRWWITEAPGELRRAKVVKTRRKKRITMPKKAAETKSKRRHYLGIRFDAGRFR
ncbi:hypothetical protein RchiOBHm_Chr6g0267241 [Rosa chinensis]|uniref:Uncharacterized protein n=1 Tax=Rosa chinensis TaxID=74649 RepID=A0A2P6PPW5_ROSCH|nr:hypothetical protein RchiOBHm_Chr6g0267241 [Rosa chinensis]